MQTPVSYRVLLWYIYSMNLYHIIIDPVVMVMGVYSTILVLKDTQPYFVL